MHNLVIDIGNTNAKLAVFSGRELIDYQVHKQITPEILKAVSDRYPVTAATVSSVAGNAGDIAGMLDEKTSYLPFSTALNTGIKNHYRSVATLGPDRWAKIIAANYYYPGRDCLIIDLGTCITCDLLNRRSEYYGGSISPGIHMRFAALNHYTGKLPLVAWDSAGETEILPGTDTINAIRNGVLQGVIYELEGVISHEHRENGELMVLITGGDARFLLEQLKNTIFAPQLIHDPYLVLKGLNEVIVFEHVQKD